MLISWTKTNPNKHAGQFLGRSIEVRLAPEGWRVLVDGEMAEQTYPTVDRAKGAIESLAQEYMIEQLLDEIRTSFPSLK